MPTPTDPRIYHVVHRDRLPSIISDGCLWCDAEVGKRPIRDAPIGIRAIKQRRQNTPLSSHPDLHVGDCVPFYFCPRSIMLYVIHKADHPELFYRDGQEPIIHIEADLRQTVAWAEENNQRWAFTLSNAGANYFEDRCDLERLSEIDWNAVKSKQWDKCKEGKQAEFLIEKKFPWKLISRIGVQSEKTYRHAIEALQAATHRPCVEVKREWYY